MRHHARDDLDLIRLLTLRCEALLSRPAPIKIALDVLFGERNEGRTAVNHAADRNPVALAKGRHTEQVAKSVVRHCASSSKPATVVARVNNRVN